MKVYINSISRLSTLDPEPDYRAYLTPIEGRRLSRMMKKAVAVVAEAVQGAPGIEPEAIITGTGLGSIENTEAFLWAIKGISEEAPRPTNFMQSTHNTAGSLIAIKNHNHGYNATYANVGTSFESALMDAWMQIRLGDLSSAVVAAFEEMTPTYARMLSNSGFNSLTPDGKLSETAVAMVLSTKAEGAVCEVADVDILGADDGKVFPGASIIRREDYVGTYGDNYSVSALGVADGAARVRDGEQTIVILNDFLGKQFARTVLRKIC